MPDLSQKNGRWRFEGKLGGHIMTDSLLSLLPPTLLPMAMTPQLRDGREPKVATQLQAANSSYD
jgi:hypothetical protein